MSLYELTIYDCSYILACVVASSTQLQFLPNNPVLLKIQLNLYT